VIVFFASSSSVATIGPPFLKCAVHSAPSVAA
jgi:hypothetical protein